MLHIRGRFIMCADSTPEKKAEDSKPKFDWADAVIDALIMAGVSGGAAYIGAGSEVGAIKAAFIAFVTFLAIKRGLIKKTGD